MSATVKVKARGPLVIEGDFEVVDPQGQALCAGLKKVALCRCGASKARPLCDGSHHRIGFGDDEPPPGSR